jgi:hypothetical protein
MLAFKLQMPENNQEESMWQKYFSFRAYFRQAVFCLCNYFISTVKSTSKFARDQTFLHRPHKTCRRDLLRASIKPIETVTGRFDSSSF